MDNHQDGRQCPARSLQDDDVDMRLLQSAAPARVIVQMTPAEFDQYIEAAFRHTAALSDPRGLEINPSRQVGYSLVGPGWRGLLDMLYDFSEDVRLRPFRVRSKFGTLRVSWPWHLLRPDLRSSELWHTATSFGLNLTDRSGHLCEVCGERGRLVDDPGQSWWKATLCEEHVVARSRGDSWTQLMGYQPYCTPRA